MRRVIALAVGLVLSTLLLGGGWLWSSWRERAARIAEARQELVRTADTVRAAVDESLEELRAREHQQPFYLYNYYYSPPDVLAITDPVAISPLARPPRDERLVGYFQIMPGGSVTTPYAPDETSDRIPRSHRIREVVSGNAFAPVRALATGDQRGTMLARPELLAQNSLPAPDALRIQAFGATREEEERALPQSPQVPLTVNMNPWSAAQVQDIQAAQAGDMDANARLAQRGRQVPIISRRDVPWHEAGGEPGTNTRPGTSTSARTNPIEPREPSVARPSRAAVRGAMEDARASVEACSRAAPLAVRVSFRGSDGRAARVEIEGATDSEAPCIRGALSHVTLPPFRASSLLVRYAYRAEPSACGPDGCDPLQAAVPSDAALDNMVRREAEVDYTPMRFRQLGDALVLHRVVSHGGASVVQGALLDRRALVDEWIPNVVARHVEGRAPSVVEAGEGRCALRRPASGIVPGVELCYPQAVLTSAIAGVDAELGWQLGALAALWIMALLAAAAIVASARRAEALSRQKSAFVSAVSHELRTPLTTLRMHAEMLEEGLVTEARRPKVHAELVRESVRLSRLVDNVLSLSRLEEGRRRIRPSEGDLARHVRDVVEGQRRFVEERGFTLRAPEGSIDARFDAQAVEQIVVNLLDNAVKYGGGETKAIEVDVERGGVIVVRDRGPGIPASERRKVFERFHRVEREETAHAPGTGIGLALVAELAQAHGGDASVHPREGGGLEVRVRLAAEA